MKDLVVYVNRYMLITMIITTMVVVEMVRKVVVEGVEVLRERLTRRVVEDLDLISEISCIRSALILNRKIHVDIHGSYLSNTSTWMWSVLSMDIQLDIHPLPSLLTSPRGIDTCVGLVRHERLPTLRATNLSVCLCLTNHTIE